MLKLREDLLAGREEVAVASGSVAGPHPPPVSEATLGVLAVSSALSKQGAKAAGKEEQHRASAEEGNTAAPTSAGHHPVVMLLEVASRTFSWVGSILAGGLDFICDGRCGPLGVERRMTKSLIVN